MAWKLPKLLSLLAVLAYAVAEEEDEEAAYSEALANSEDATGSEDIGSSQTPSSVYVDSPLLWHMLSYVCRLHV